MNQKETDLLFELINAYGVSGYEDRVRDIIKREFKGVVDKISVDKMGNLICHKKGKRPRIMLAAHMDEVGLVVKKISISGKIFFGVVGGLESIALIGQKIHIQTTIPDKPLHGILTFHHLHDAHEISESIPPLEDLYIDTGLDGAGLKAVGVKIGNYAALEEKAYFAGSKNFIAGKALDDRVGCFILIQLARKLKKLNQEIIYAFTVQEEVGLYGAKTSTYNIDPDLAVAVDVTNAMDSEKQDINAVGRGPFITIKDAEMISNRKINDHLEMLAKKKKIPLQLEVTDAGTTDAMYISISKSGVPSTVVGVTVRNLHSTMGIASIDDISKAIVLLEAFLRNPPKKFF
ncbi:MAG: M20/M25/M40 family metallo-hydrolase [Candidatus Diapherotrites archaeon]|nr:M20/M25/M40 family metallo-hydrolase [Candidatus Diapherotrites archaeon]